MGHAGEVERRREDYFMPGKSALETALILSTEIPRAFGKAPKEANMLEQFIEVVQLFQREGIRFCVVGELAVGHHSIPRTTTDADFLVGFEDAERVRALLAEHYVHGSADFMTFEIRGTKMDVMRARLRFHESALAEAKPGVVDGVEAPIAPVRELLIMKLFAAAERTKMVKAEQDRVDTLRIVEQNRWLTRKDFEYIAGAAMLVCAWNPASARKLRTAFETINALLNEQGRSDAKIELP